MIGLVKYLSKFLNNLSQICKPIRRLTHKDAEWRWSAEQDEAFRKIKEAVTTAPVLQYFDATRNTEGCGDASSQGIGFVLTQDEHPITYASRALASAEQRYSQIEKELLALVFGLEHNHYYTYGRKLTMWTDHKALVSIAKKPLVSAPKRLQRLMLRQRDVRGRHPLESLHSQPPTIRRGERSREYTLSQPPRHLPGTTCRNTKGDPERPHLAKAEGDYNTRLAQQQGESC